MIFSAYAQPSRGYTAYTVQPSIATPLQVVTPVTPRYNPALARSSPPTYAARSPNASLNRIQSTEFVGGSYGASYPVPSQGQVRTRPANTTRSADGGFGPRAAKVIGTTKIGVSGSASPRGGMTGAGNIQSLLADRAQLKEAVVKAFKSVAGSQRGVDINGLRRMRREIAASLGVPEAVFGTIDDEYIRFDFDGTGFLEANEVYKLIKWHLYEHVKAQDAAAGRNLIPTKTIRQAGYTITDELGAGNQASLKVCCDKFGNQRCIKCFPKASMQNMFSIEEMQEEFETMQRLACRNIARTFEIFQDPTMVYMVNEVYHGGDFRKLKEKATAKCGSLSEDWWRDVFGQCLDGLVFMHQQAMMHCDVKEPNLMMRSNNYMTPQVVLIDFGVSKAMTAKETGSVSGTPGYMPPETMNMGKWYPGGDVFSLGVVMFQMMTDRIPDDEAAKKGAPMIGLFLEGCTTMEHVTKALNTRRPPLQTMRASRALQQVTGRMLEKNMRTRPKAPAVLKDPFFGGFSPTKNVEMVMEAQHPLATVGITEEMLAAP